MGVVRKKKKGVLPKLIKRRLSVSGEGIWCISISMLFRNRNSLYYVLRSLLRNELEGLGISIYGTKRPLVLNRTVNDQRYKDIRIKHGVQSHIHEDLRYTVTFPLWATRAQLTHH